MAPGEEIQVVVSLIFPVTMAPLTNYFVDTLNFATATESYRVILMFNDTINIYNSVKQNSLPNQGLSISPNPANDKTLLIFDADDSGKAEMKIFNSTGAVVRSESLSGLTTGLNNRQIDVSNLQQGIYIVALRSDKRSYSARLVIR
jgi:hypothetical protein